MSTSRCVFFPSCERPSFIPIHKITNRIIFLCNVAGGGQRILVFSAAAIQSTDLPLTPSFINSAVVYMFSYLNSARLFKKKCVGCLHVLVLFLICYKKLSYFVYGSIGVYVKGEGHPMTCLCRNRREVAA